MKDASEAAMMLLVLVDSGLRRARTELSPAAASLDPLEASGRGFGPWSSVIANSQRLEST
jgi:hypothetical protein